MDASTFELHAAMEDHHWWFAGRRKIVREILHRLAPPGVKRTVVDVGCGTGATVNAFSTDYRMIGIEPSEDAVALARRRFPDAEFIRGTAPADLGSLATETDVFLLMDVLEHVADEIAMLSDIITVARPGSHILITVPARPELWSQHDVTMRHYRRYMPDTLAEIWRGLPVTPRLVSYFNARLYPVVRAARLISRVRKQAVGAGATDLSLPPAPVNRMLTRVLAGEAGPLVRHLENGRTPLYPIGVSLIAVLRRGNGDVVRRSRETEGTLAAEPPTVLPPS
jgi:SAM-dependent methyltransferase